MPRAIHHRIRKAWSVPVDGLDEPCVEYAPDAKAARSGIIPIYQDDAEKCGQNRTPDLQRAFSGTPAPFALSRTTRLTGAVMIAAALAGCDMKEAPTPRACVEAGKVSTFNPSTKAHECTEIGGRSNG